MYFDNHVRLTLTSNLSAEVPSRTRALNCAEVVPLEPGCAIINGKCKCMGWSQTCQITGLRWDFKNLEVSNIWILWVMCSRCQLIPEYSLLQECQLNLENLIRNEVDFDEDYPIKVPATSRFR